MSDMTPEIANTALMLLQKASITPPQIPAYKQVERALLSIAQPQPVPHPALKKAAADKVTSA